MFKILADIALRNNNKKNLWISAILTGIILLLFNLLINPAIMKSSGGFGMLDMLAFQGKDLYLETLQSYTAKSKFIYTLGLSLDMIFPLVYGFLLFGMIRRQINKPVASWAVLLCIALDYAENAGILLLLSSGFLHYTLLPRFLYLITCLKFVALGISILISLYAIILKYVRQESVS